MAKIWSPLQLKISSNTSKNITRMLGIDNVVSLLIKKKKQYLGASPDLPIECSCFGEAAVEIMNPFSIANEIPSAHNLSYLWMCNGQVALKQQNQYFAPVQGKMAITRRALCYFFVNTRKGLHLETIRFNATYWRRLEENLTWFYSNLSFTSPNITAKIPRKWIWLRKCYTFYSISWAKKTCYLQRGLYKFHNAAQTMIMLSKFPIREIGSSFLIVRNVFSRLMAYSTKNEQISYCLSFLCINFRELFLCTFPRRNKKVSSVRWPRRVTHAN